MTRVVGAWLPDESAARAPATADEMHCAAEVAMPRWLAVQHAAASLQTEPKVDAAASGVADAAAVRVWCR